MAARPVLLATGFGPFPGAPENPTATLVGDLAGWHPHGAMLVSEVLPVRWDVVDTVLSPLLERVRPDAIVAFGLAARATGFVLETTARNRCDIDRVDAAGQRPSGARLHPDGPETRPSGLPLGALAAALVAADAPTMASDDAGAYVCNLVFYRIAAAPRGGFVHVGPLPRALLLAGAQALLTTLAREITDATAGRT